MSQLTKYEQHCTTSIKDYTSKVKKVVDVHVVARSELSGLTSWRSGGVKHTVDMEQSGSAELQGSDMDGDSSERRAAMLLMMRVIAEPMASAEALLSESIDQSAGSTSAGTCNSHSKM